MIEKHINSYFLSVVLVALLFLTSCGDSSNTGNWNKKEPAFGPVNQVNVLADKDIWNGMVGDSVRYYLETPYPILLQPEPEFDVRYISPEKFRSTRLIKNLRTYFFLINLNNDDSQINKITEDHFASDEILSDKKAFTTKMSRDRWSEGQLLIYLIGRDRNALMKGFKEYYPTIANKIHDFDEKLIKKGAYLEGHNSPLRKKVKEEFGLDIDFPGDYRVAIQNDTFGWYRYDQDVATSSILVSEREYQGQEQFEKIYIKEWMNTITERFVEGEQKASYMVINDEDLPLLRETKRINDRYTVILRGIWEMTRDFMGGTFVTYVIHDKADNKIYLVEGFLYAPGEDKRNYMQRIEYVLKNIRLS